MVSLKRRLLIVPVCSGLLGEIGFLCAGWHNGRNWLDNSWMGRTDQTDRMGQRWDVGTGVRKGRISSATIGS